MSRLALLLVLTTLCPIHRALAMSGLGQQAQQSAPAAPQSPFAGLIAEYLRRDANGHSPTPDEIGAMASLQPAPDPASIAEAMPYLLKALENPDIPLHTFALTTIAGLQTAPPAPTAEAPAPAGPATYKPEVAKALLPFLPQIAAHLTSEEAQPNRILTAAILGGFTPNPPAAVYAPLLAYLKRDEAISPVGLAVVTDLIELGPISDDTAAAITRFLRRSDQTSDLRSNLADLIATSPNQSQTLNKSLLAYLDSDDNSLRARVILSLPQLDLQIVTAAKSVAPCWTAPKMASGCPVY
jgi:hypothetical protein